MKKVAVTLLGIWGLGAATSFKLDSLTPEGNERGSNAVTIVRPLGVP